MQFADGLLARVAATLSRCLLQPIGVMSRSEVGSCAGEAGTADHGPLFSDHKKTPRAGALLATEDEMSTAALCISQDTPISKREAAGAGGDPATTVMAALRILQS